MNHPPDVSHPTPLYVSNELDDAGLSVHAFRIAGRIARRWSAAHGCYERVNEMATACGMDRKTAWKAIAELRERGIIIATPRLGSTTRYDFAPVETWMYLSHDTVHPRTARRAVPSGGLSHEKGQGGVPPDGTGPVPPDGTQKVTKKVTNEGIPKEPRAKARPVPVALPDFVDPTVWARWERHRSEIKKALKPTTIEAQIKQLTKWNDEGHDPNAILDRAIAAGWTGLYAPDAPRAARSGPAARPTGANYARVSDIVDAALGL